MDDTINCQEVIGVPKKNAHVISQTFEHIWILYKTMANTQSKIDSLEEQISKLVTENDKLRRENAEIPELRRG